MRLAVKLRSSGACTKTMSSAYFSNPAMIVAAFIEDRIKTGAQDPLTETARLTSLSNVQNDLATRVWALAFEHFVRNPSGLER
jgi:hypothetical protein